MKKTTNKKSVQKCLACGVEIPEGRLKAVPGTKTCTEHSNENAYYANQVVHNDEDYCQLEFIKDPNAIAEIKRLSKLSVKDI